MRKEIVITVLVCFVWILVGVAAYKKKLILKHTQNRAIYAGIISGAFDAKRMKSDQEWKKLLTPS